MGFEVFDDVAFSWFGMSVLGTFLAPYTVYLFLSCVCRSHPHHRKTQRERLQAKFASGKSTPLHTSVSKKHSKSVLSLHNLCLLAGWGAFCFLAYQVSLHQAEELVTFDPYSILELEIGASEAEIKKAYRTKSKLYHPDRNRDNPEAETQFIFVSKAYETLTDTAARENWEKYGNPDGYSGTSVTIGLPSFLINQDNELAILILYFFAFLIVLPTVVGIWWKVRSQYDTSGTDMESLGIFWQTLHDSMPPKFLLEVLSASAEYRVLGKKGTEASLSALVDLQRQLGDDLTPTRLAGGKLAYVNKTNILLHAYLFRLDIPHELADDMSYVLSHAHRLLKSMLDVCIWKKLHQNIIPIIGLSQCITQAVWIFGSQMQQVPGADVSKVRALTRQKIKSLRKLGSLTPEERKSLKSLTKGISLFDEKELAAVETFVDALPKVEMSISVDVDGSSEVRQDDVATLRVKLVRLGDVQEPEKPSPAAEEPSVEENHDDDDDLDSKQRRGSNEMMDVDVLERAKFDEVDEEDCVEAHAPFFPLPKQENWVLLIFNDKRHLVKLEKVQALRRTVLKDITVQLQDAGDHSFEFVLICDSYIGLDVRSSINIHVLKKPAPVLEDISDEEKEDSVDEAEEEEEEEGYWYFLGGSNIWEGLLHLFLIYIIALLLADILESRGYISWNPFKSSVREDPRFSEEGEESPQHDEM